MMPQLTLRKYGACLQYSSIVEMSLTVGPSSNRNIDQNCLVEIFSYRNDGVVV